MTKQLLACFLIIASICCKAGISLPGPNEKKKVRSTSAFLENKGQVRGFNGEAHPEVKYLFEAGDLRIFLLEGSIAYQFTRMHYPAGLQELLGKKGNGRDGEQIESLSRQIRTETFRMDMRLVGANKNPTISTEGESSDYTHFYNHDALNVRGYNKIIYHDVYPQIDWIIYTSEKSIKYDFVLRSGADPGKIKFEVLHDESFTLNADGGLTIKNRMGTVTEKMPVSYQDGKTIKTSFVLDDGLFGFSLGAYDAGKTLTIDPPVEWSTYYGGSGYDDVSSCATDANGNVYITGISASTGAIAVGGYQNLYGGGTYDAYLVKFNGAGVRQWSTYYGGSGLEFGRSVAVDISGDVYLAGSTRSFGLASGGHQNSWAGNTDAFLVKFDNSGTRLWATYYGSTGDDYGACCVTDVSGNVYLSGATQSNNNIATPGAHQTTIGGTFDCFLVKFSSAGARQWATYCGGTGSDDNTSCATDPSGNIFISGTTNGNDGIASSGHQAFYGGGSEDGFLVKFNGSGVRQWGTYYGGSNIDQASSCATDLNGNVYLAGSTFSSNDIATVNGNQNSYIGSWDGFFVKFDPNGLRLWGTYYGNFFMDIANSCFTDAAGNAFLAGYTETGSSSDDDAFLARFNTSGVLNMVENFGSSVDDYGWSATIDGMGSLYLAGYTSSSSGIASGGHQNGFGGGTHDGFLVKYGCITPEFNVSSNRQTICPGESVILTVDTNFAYTWSPGGPGNSITVAPMTTTAYTVTAADLVGCTAAQEITINVNPCTGFASSVMENRSALFYPNPNSGELFVELTDIAECTILNTLGEVVMKQALVGGKNKLDFSQHANGIYLVMVKQGEINTAYKIIKE